jgi:hypothetical protein
LAGHFVDHIQYQIELAYFIARFPFSDFQRIGKNSSIFGFGVSVSVGQCRSCLDLICGPINHFAGNPFILNMRITESKAAPLLFLVSF